MREAQFNSNNWLKIESIFQCEEFVLVDCKQFLSGKNTDVSTFGFTK